ncbi:UDP-N-acetylglucosamine 1-carboxyvinyltransferase [Deinococcus peraridilitoris]|uniref:UDP-N-acetylglucosamine 1-carboxyvinyltransferase n=1 Tax=Deinococcus peraridilitoris (strain DSM 19664 / LMG 22246 / CIP 109416 / KR-200) TaxID=937777 RepID=L0A3P8_DEIPD|nr:UDP-N-acetylglucosamine 1-carboxyvinyltransferase [Deinococcus peraridilitoris]AFZ67812.1 UDP-N-acetylglucosamine 1-carboxyvinyltransferase [Deinococcus peraridilitoris DSM 19664]
MPSESLLVIQGGQPLHGEFVIQPSKNAALPILAATLLTRHSVTVHGVPQLSDVYTLLRILGTIGARHAWIGPHSLVIHTPEILTVQPPAELVGQLRASFTLLGALLSRAGEARLGQPGGCTFSQRPIDQHLKALRAMGARVSENNGAFHVVRPAPLSGNYLFELLTVGGTQNAILAAVLGEGQVVLENCSTDTDVVDMVNFLNALGADIHGAGTATITVSGVKELRGGEYHVIPDRLEAGTLMLAAAATRGQVTLTNVRTAHLRAVSAKLREVGVTITEHPDGTALSVDARQHRLQAVNVTATEYPGFPTDLQPIIGALLSTVRGTSILMDRIYTRTTHVAELRRMGAQIELADHVMVVTGASLRGTRVKAADIRSGAALVVAALAAQGESVIENVHFLQRGYEDLAARLTPLGAQVQHHEATLPLAMD